MKQPANPLTRDQLDALRKEIKAELDKWGVAPPSPLFRATQSESNEIVKFSREINSCWLSISAKPNTLARSFSTVGWILLRVLPGVLDDQAEQRQSFLLLVDNFPRQDVELGLQASRTAVNVQHVREQHKIHRADRTTVIDAHIE